MLGLKIIAKMIFFAMLRLEIDRHITFNICTTNSRAMMQNMQGCIIFAANKELKSTPKDLFYYHFYCNSARMLRFSMLERSHYGLSKTANRISLAFSGFKDKWTDGKSNGRTDTPSYRDARTHLETAAGENPLPAQISDSY